MSGAAAEGARSLKHAAGSYSDIFKHVVLSKILPRMTLYSPSALTFVDFTPTLTRTRMNPTSSAHFREGLDLLYGHARHQFSERRTSFFQPYIGHLKRFNGQKNLQVPPAIGAFPMYYPSSTGLANLFLRDDDRVFLVTPEHHYVARLEEEYQDDKRVTVIPQHASVDTVKVLLPPLTRNGVLYFDLDEAFSRSMDHQGEDEQARYMKFLSGKAQVIKEAVRRWPRACICVHYTLLTGEKYPPLAFLREMLKTGQQYILNTYMYNESQGNGIGSLIINPPPAVSIDLQRNLPLLKTDVLHRGKLGAFDTISPLQVQWLTKEFIKAKHMISSECRMTWIYSKRYQGHPIRPEIEPPLEPEQWEAHLKVNTHDFIEEIEDYTDGLRQPPKITLDTAEDRRLFQHNMWNEKTTEEYEEIN